MRIEELKSLGVPEFVIEKFRNKKIDELNPAQIKAVKAGVLDGKNMVVCTPTGSGKTAIATFAITKALTKKKGKAIYLVPLRALANEKYSDYKKLFEGTGFEVGISTGDFDSKTELLDRYDLLILTNEKLDSLIRHNVPWLKHISVVVVDEIHMMNDTDRGPTLEIIITLLKQLLKNMQIIGLSATIGNPHELAEWLGAELIIDDWRPVKLHKGIYLGGKIEFE